MDVAEYGTDARWLPSSWRAPAGDRKPGRLSKQACAFIVCLVSYFIYSNEFPKHLWTRTEQRQPYLPFEIQIKCSHSVFRTECRIVTVGAECFLRTIPRPHYLWTPPARGGWSTTIIPVCGPRQRGAGGPRRSSPFDACRNVGQRS